MPLSLLLQGTMYRRTKAWCTLLGLGLGMAIMFIAQNNRVGLTDMVPLHQPEAVVATHASPAQSDKEASQVRTTKTQNDSQGQGHADDGAKRKQLLLLTYGRTGSTFTSAIISRHPGVFYLAEPLHRMAREFSIYRTPVTKKTYLKALDTVRGILTCDPLAMDSYNYESVMFASSDSTMPMYLCRRELRKPLACVDALLRMWRECHRKEMSLVKTIRMKVSWTKWYLDRFPSFKAVWLVRDIRATMYSQAQKFRNFNIERNASSFAVRLCEKVGEDLDMFRTLSAQYPGRLLAVRYEDGATEPHNFGRKLYAFAALPFSQDTLTYIDSITHPSQHQADHNTDFGYVKNDSVSAMNAWREHASWPVVKVIDQKCGHLYPSLGYKTILSLDHLRSRDSLIATPDPTVFGST